MYKRVPLNRTIKTQRLALGLDPSLVAERVGVSIHEYDDLEAYSGEAYEVISLRTLAKLCAALQIDMGELCEPDGTPADVGIGRAVDLRAARKASGLSIDELASRANVETVFLATIEADAQALMDSAIFGLIIDIGNLAALDVGGFCAKYLRAA